MHCLHSAHEAHVDPLSAQVGARLLETLFTYSVCARSLAVDAGDVPQVGGAGGGRRALAAGVFAALLELRRALHLSPATVAYLQAFVAAQRNPVKVRQGSATKPGPDL